MSHFHTWNFRTKANIDRSAECGLARSDAPYQEAPLRSLIIMTTFIDYFGLELVGHVDESPMEDVGFRTHHNFRIMNLVGRHRNTPLCKDFRPCATLSPEKSTSYECTEFEYYQILVVRKSRTVAASASAHERMSLKSLSILVLQRHSSNRQHIGEWSRHQRRSKRTNILSFGSTASANKADLGNVHASRFLCTTSSIVENEMGVAW